MSYLIFKRTLRGTPTKVTINTGEARRDRVRTMGHVDGRAGVLSPLQYGRQKEWEETESRLRKELGRRVGPWGGPGEADQLIYRGLFPRTAPQAFR